MKKFWLCIDDTDDTTKSIGTGKIANYIYERLVNRGSFMRYRITRHQLLLDPAITYTSHNSSMCMEGVSDLDPEEVFQMGIDTIMEFRSEISHPGICLYMPESEAPAHVDVLIDWGQRAKGEVLTIAQAREVAEKIPGLWLTAPAGNGNGQIGALAGVGLRLSGNDGTFKGKNPLPESIVTTAGDMKKRLGIGKIWDGRKNRYLEDDEMIRGEKQAKLIFHDYEPMAAVRMAEDGIYEICNKAQVYEETITNLTGVVEDCEFFQWDNDPGEQWSEKAGSCENCLYRRLTGRGMKCTRPGLETGGRK